MQLKPWMTLAAALLLVTFAGFAYRFYGGAEPPYTAPVSEMPGRGITGNAQLVVDPYDVLITYTADGFTPRDVTVQQGQRVRFLNASSEEIWPASGIHPTHSLYPEKQSTDCLGSSFDSCRPLTNGEFFDYTFHYVGTWRFHDHDHAYQTGSITVTQLP